MPTLQIPYDTEAERLQYGKLIAFGQELIRLGRTAAHGTVIDTCESFAVEAGRAMLRDQLEAALRAQGEVEKKVPARDQRATRADG